MERKFLFIFLITGIVFVSGCTSGPQEPVCGDDVCNSPETSTTCPQDCQLINMVCGDSVCNNGETEASCPEDCETPAVPICGDGTCDSEEDEISCPQDCEVIQPGDTRQFFMGMNSIPIQPLSTDNWIESFTVMGENSDFVLAHANFLAEDWETFSEGLSEETSTNIESLNFVTGMAATNGLKNFIVIDPLTPNRIDINDLPSAVGTSFADDEVREAFKNYAVRVARDYRPEYLGLFSELNTYIENHPEDQDNVLLAIQEAYSAVKAIAPNTIITTSFQYDAITGTYDRTSQWEILELFEPELDAVAITTYPSPYFETPADIPDNYFTQINDHTSKPIIIAESGWPTGGDAAYHGSEENQAAFLERIVELTDGIDLDLWIWWFFHDWDGEGYADFFKTMGLRASSGVAKQGWLVWQNIHSKQIE